MLGLYVHIPFCTRKCAYCDFHSVVAGEELVGNYLEALANEITYTKGILASEVISTLYIGGGTPTRLHCDQLIRVIDHLKRSFTWSPDLEFTLEANPETLTKEKASLLASLGVNRLSLGAQAFQDRILRLLGRAHDRQDIFQSIAFAHDAGIGNVSLDLIYGLPEQTLDDWSESLELALSAQPQHLSCYALSVEENTPFFHRRQQGTLALPGEDLEAAMFAYIHETLPAQGFEHYEISNFARPGFRAKHNLIYWQNLSYLGLGSGAHSYYNSRRYENTSNLPFYINRWQKMSPAIEASQGIDPDRAMDDTMMLGLRLLDGIKRSDFKERFGKSYDHIYGAEIWELISRGLVEDTGEGIRLTQRGLFLGNLVFAAFIRKSSR